MDEAADRSIHPVDAHVGSRVRAQRKILRVSQQKLADELGLTFQQVQKYERGTNRISASKLWEIARALDVEVGFFFSGLTGRQQSHGFAEEGAATFSHDFLMTSEGVELSELFPRLKPSQRRKILELIRTMADDAEG
ncbi:MAG: helix-turn-helix domain-containing protein [Brevundimonas sp.]|jgi:transcriptional regulator with XRE-family HTH domain|uniref:helix-turn-helix domain-containing protein n=1 Tax=Brevundimonas sp. TaxID=1871086 RepID=UPI0039196012